MIYGYARISTDGQSLDAQVKQLRAAGAEKVFRETASGARADRAQLRRAIDAIDKGDVLTVTRLDPLGALDPRPPEHAATINGKSAGFRSLNVMADTTTADGRLMVTRTTEGRDRAKAKGVRMGPKFKLTTNSFPGPT
jgi:DNA invertase Pin-like site-specific DNA recombinase